MHIKIHFYTGLSSIEKIDKHALCFGPSRSRTKCIHITCNATEMHFRYPSLGQSAQFCWSIIVRHRGTTLEKRKFNAADPWRICGTPTRFRQSGGARAREKKNEDTADADELQKFSSSLFPGRTFSCISNARPVPSAVEGKFYQPVNFLIYVAANIRKISWEESK